MNVKRLIHYYQYRWRSRLLNAQGATQTFPYLCKIMSSHVIDTSSSGVWNTIVVFVSTKSRIYVGSLRNIERLISKPKVF